jgi:hypothetical protein
LQGLCIELLQENNNPLRRLGVYDVANASGHLYRPIEASLRTSPHCRSRWTGMSCSAVPCWSGCGHLGPSRRGHCGKLEPTPAGFAQEQECWKVQSRQRD